MINERKKEGKETVVEAAFCLNLHLWRRQAAEDVHMPPPFMQSPEASWFCDFTAQEPAPCLTA